MAIWDKGYSVNQSSLDFTVGDDYILDKDLILYDCMASKIHAEMLEKIKVLSKDECLQINQGLSEIEDEVKKGTFIIKKEEEDCHTAIENYLTNKFGEVGKKIHTGRSRNDQVLTALRLYEKDCLKKTIELTITLKSTLADLAKNNQDTPLPGYTHMRKAMPTTVAIWLESFCASLDDDIKGLNSIIELIDQSPLGTAAGFGVPVFNVDREFSSEKLNFKQVMENPMYSQITRGKFEGNIINSCSQIMFTLNKLSTDLITFSMSEFDYIKLPIDQCTGSSIMPQKVNPDVLEIIRAKYFEVIGEEFKVKSLIGNLISGYNRDVQLTKKSLMVSLNSTLDCLKVMNEFVASIKINEQSCLKAMSKELYATEEVNKLVQSGESFRSAYRKVGSTLVKKV